jgi:hypothetical protein
MVGPPVRRRNLAIRLEVTKASATGVPVVKTARRLIFFFLNRLRSSLDGPGEPVPEQDPACSVVSKYTGLLDRL